MHYFFTTCRLSKILLAPMLLTDATRHNSVKDRLCACVFKCRNAVVAGIYDDFMVQLD